VPATRASTIVSSNQKQLCAERAWARRRGPGPARADASDVLTRHRARSRGGTASGPCVTRPSRTMPSSRRRSAALISGLYYGVTTPSCWCVAPGLRDGGRRALPVRVRLACRTFRPRLTLDRDGLLNMPAWVSSRSWPSGSRTCGTDRAATLPTTSSSRSFPSSSRWSLSPRTSRSKRDRGADCRIDPLMPERRWASSTLSSRARHQQRPRLSLWLLLPSGARRAGGRAADGLNLSYDVRSRFPGGRCSCSRSWSPSDLPLDAPLQSPAALGSSAGSAGGQAHVDQFWALLWAWLRWPIRPAG